MSKADKKRLQAKKKNEQERQNRSEDHVSSMPRPTLADAKLQAVVDDLRQKRDEYAQKWSAANAAKFETDGHYEWMSSFLQGYRKVLEIGTGDGRGTLALLNAQHTVISIDENPQILALAQQRLHSAGKKWFIRNGKSYNYIEVFTLLSIRSLKDTLMNWTYTCLTVTLTMMSTL